jgi:hypothetical protein
MAGDDVNTILTVYVHEFERAKRQDEIPGEAGSGNEHPARLSELTSLSRGASASWWNPQSPLAASRLITRRREPRDLPQGASLLLKSPSRLKPTRGFEPRTPSLRVMEQCLLGSAPVLWAAFKRANPRTGADWRGLERTTRWTAGGRLRSCQGRKPVLPVAALLRVMVSGSFRRANPVASPRA